MNLLTVRQFAEKHTWRAEQMQARQAHPRGDNTFRGQSVFSFVVGDDRLSISDKRERVRGMGFCDVRVYSLAVRSNLAVTGFCYRLQNPLTMGAKTSLGANLARVAICCLQPAACRVWDLVPDIRSPVGGLDSHHLYQY